MLETAAPFSAIKSFTAQRFTIDNHDLTTAICSLTTAFTTAICRPSVPMNFRPGQQHLAGLPPVLPVGVNSLLIVPYS